MGPIDNFLRALARALGRDPEESGEIPREPVPSRVTTASKFVPEESDPSHRYAEITGTVRDFVTNFFHPHQSASWETHRPDEIADGIVRLLISQDAHQRRAGTEIFAQILASVRDYAKHEHPGYGTQTFNFLILLQNRLLAVSPGTADGTEAQKHLNQIKALLFALYDPAFLARDARELLSSDNPARIAFGNALLEGLFGGLIGRDQNPRMIARVDPRFLNVLLHLQWDLAQVPPHQGPSAMDAARRISRFFEAWRPDWALWLAPLSGRNGLSESEVVFLNRLETISETSRMLSLEALESLGEALVAFRPDRLFPRFRDDPSLRIHRAVVFFRLLFQVMYPHLRARSEPRHPQQNEGFQKLQETASRLAKVFSSDAESRLIFEAAHRGHAEAFSLAGYLYRVESGFEETPLPPQGGEDFTIARTILQTGLFVGDALLDLIPPAKSLITALGDQIQRVGSFFDNARRRAEQNSPRGRLSAFFRDGNPQTDQAWADSMKRDPRFLADWRLILTGGDGCYSPEEVRAHEVIAGVGDLEPSAAPSFGLYRDVLEAFVHTRNFRENLIVIRRFFDVVRMTRDSSLLMRVIDYEDPTIYYHLRQLPETWIIALESRTDTTRFQSEFRRIRLRQRQAIAQEWNTFFEGDRWIEAHPLATRRQAIAVQERIFNRVFERWEGLSGEDRNLIGPEMNEVFIRRALCLEITRMAGQDRSLRMMLTLGDFARTSALFEEAQSYFAAHGYVAALDHDLTRRPHVNFQRILNRQRAMAAIRHEFSITPADISAWTDADVAEWDRIVEDLAHHPRELTDVRAYVAAYHGVTEAPVPSEGPASGSRPPRAEGVSPGFLEGEEGEMTPERLLEIHEIFRRAFGGNWGGNRGGHWERQGRVLH